MKLLARTRSFINDREARNKCARIIPGSGPTVDVEVELIARSSCNEATNDCQIISLALQQVTELYVRAKNRLLMMTATLMKRVRLEVRMPRIVREIRTYVPRDECFVRHRFESVYKQTASDS